MLSVLALVLSLLISLSAAPVHAGVTRIDRITITVADVARTEQFYRDAFGFATPGQRC
jgi:catechol-2,3-dioxygenase